jgi:N-ethylmaleimide reductase
MNRRVVCPIFWAGPRFRPLITGDTRLIVAGGYKPAEAESLLHRGEADAIAFGRLFLANPDLPRRIAEDASLNPYDRSTFYAREMHGYLDYHTLAQVRARQSQEEEQDKRLCRS